MIATDFKLIPLAILHKHEDTVLSRLDSLPFFYPKSLLDEPEIRYAFLYFILLTYWPELLNGKMAEMAPEEILYNRLYWFLRLSKQYEVHHDFEPEFEQQIGQVIETSNCELGSAVVHEVEDKVLAELATNQKEIAVSFSDFSISKVKREIGLELDETGDFFASVTPVGVSALLRDVLRDNTPLALAIGTEKARSELIISPVLVEVRRQLANAVSLFSGIEIDVDSAQGLRGVLDFLLCRSPHQLVMEAPVIAVVEAKKEDITAGIGQCLAEMVAARIFNQQNKNEIPTIYGVVTTGSLWKFLRLVEATAYVDVTEYHIKEVERIVGIIVSMLK